MSKRKRRRMPRLRNVYVLPNLFTAFNMALGLLALMTVLDGNVIKACWLVVLAGVLDGLDGAVARITRSQSDFGVQFDSLSDLVSFGIAPAAVAYNVLKIDLGIFHPRLIAAICVVYAICAALRLARFNVQFLGSERRGFLGLPTPGAAGVVIAPSLIIHQYLLPGGARSLLSIGQSSSALTDVAAAVFPFLVLAAALMMVSEVPYPKITNLLRLRGHVSFNALVTFIIVVILIWALQSNERALILFIIAFVYFFYGPGLLLFRALFRQKSSAGENSVERRESKQDA